MTNDSRNCIGLTYRPNHLALLVVAVATRARNASDSSISMESIVIHRHPKNKRSGGKQWCFDEKGAVFNDQSAGVQACQLWVQASRIRKSMRPL